MRGPQLSDLISRVADMRHSAGTRVFMTNYDSQRHPLQSRGGRGKIRNASTVFIGLKLCLRTEQVLDNEVNV